jgi:hypothetical protein
MPARDLIGFDHDSVHRAEGAYRYVVAKLQRLKHGDGGLLEGAAVSSGRSSATADFVSR